VDFLNKIYEHTSKRRDNLKVQQYQKLIEIYALNQIHVRHKLEKLLIPNGAESKLNQLSVVTKLKSISKETLYSIAKTAQVQLIIYELNPGLKAMES
jgi:hypothetical protein